MTFWVGMSIGIFQTQQFQPQTLIFDQFQIKDAFFIA